MADKQNQRLTEIKTAMLLHVPFFASLLLDRMQMKVGKFEGIFPPGNETAATNGKMIWIDEDFLNSLSLPEGVFLICHEVGHAMWQHMSRGKQYSDIGLGGKPFDHRLWNIAGDYVINDMLVQSKIGSMPKVGIHDPKFSFDMLVDDVYRALLKQQQQQGGSSGSGQQGQGGQQQGSGGGNLPAAGGTGSGTSMDIHVLEPDNTSPAEWARAVQTAAEAAKAQGKLPAALRRFVDDLLNPRVPWQEKLRYHVTRAISRDSHTWARPHKRRLVVQGIVMPSYTGFSAGHVVVAVDTSGSIGQKELRVFMSELQEILDICKPTAVTVLAIDAKVHDVTELNGDESLVDNMPPLCGGGGTSFIPAFDWLEEQGVVPAALVYFTDMYGSFPNEEPVYPTIWCSTSEGQAPPFGELIEIEIKDYDQ